MRQTQPCGAILALALSFALINLTYGQDVYNSQEITTPFLSPDEALKSIKVPEGFEVDLFAAEPMVQQPIGMAWDEKGRLWIAENYTYAESAKNFDKELNDRIIVLQDTDGDGKADDRKVFWDQAKKLSSVEIGFDGVWALCPPNLYFIPDRNRDAIADGPPEVVLNGFDDDRVRHNLVNGLRWGPDGWLYGRHGILATSRVGRPDQSDFERTPVNTGVWRYHPITKDFNMVCDGTTNPWGMDWDENGNLFFINTVIGHLWHALPGAHLQRMYGEDLDPHIYQLMPQIADHVHWNSAAEEWSSIRSKGVTPETDKAGGGHAHVGMMIYQGSNWPEAYRNQLYTLNLHGRRINQDTLHREGAGYVGHHGSDFFFVGDPWYRGIELSAASDGSVYVLDWSDIGECHENDGVHRTSGRIYRVRYGKIDPAKALTKDLGAASDAELVQLLKHSDAWQRRMAKQLLASRAAKDDLGEETFQSLTHLVKSEKKTRDRLEALWAIHGCRKSDPAMLIELLRDQDEMVRLWGMNLLLDAPNSSADVGKAIFEMLKGEKSDLVKLYTSGKISQLRSDNAWDSINLLLAQGHLAKDRDYPLLLWSGIKDHVARSPDSALENLSKVKLPLLVEFISRRIASDQDQRPIPFDRLISGLGNDSMNDEARSAALEGIGRALRGRRKVSMPPSWPDTLKKLDDNKSAPYHTALAKLGVTFGQGIAIDQIRSMVTDGGVSKAERREALASLVEAQAPGIAPLAWQIAGDRDLAPAAMKALAATGTPDDALEMVKRFSSSAPEIKVAIIQSLSGNRKFVGVLLDAVEQSKIAATEIDAATLRQMQMTGDPAVVDRIGKLWPHVRLIAGNKLPKIQELEKELNPAQLAKADLKSGKALWAKTCATCHRLYGEGAQIGPDLTGAQRSNLRYVLENVVDPSASVVDKFRITLFFMDDDQLISGVPLQDDDKTVTVQTVKEKVVLLKGDIASRKPSEQSLMPDGLLDSLDSDARRDLVAYIMTSQ